VLKSDMDRHTKQEHSIKKCLQCNVVFLTNLDLQKHRKCCARIRRSAAKAADVLLRREEGGHREEEEGGHREEEEGGHREEEGGHREEEGRHREEEGGQRWDERGQWGGGRSNRNYTI
jgi:hypothetical protein